MFSEFCELLWHIDWTQGGVHRNPWFIASPSEAQVITQTFNWSWSGGSLVRLRLESVGLKPSRTLWGSWLWKVFLCPPFLDLPWVPKGRFRHGREEMKTQGRSNQATTVQHWDRILALSRDTQNSISEFFWKFQQTENVNYLRHSLFQREVHSLITSRTTDHQETIWGHTKKHRGLPWWYSG